MQNPHWGLRLDRAVRHGRHGRHLRHLGQILPSGPLGHEGQILSSGLVRHGGQVRQILSSGPLRQNRQLGHGGWGDGGVVLQGVRGLGREGWEVGSAGVLLPGSFQQLLRPAQHSTPVMLDEVEMGPCLLSYLMLQGLGGLGRESGKGLHAACMLQG